MKRTQNIKNFVAVIGLGALAAAGCKKEDAKSEPAAKVTTTPTKVAPTPTQAVVSITSSKPGAVVLLREGRSLQEGFRFADATAKYKKAVEVDPDFALGHAQLAALSAGEVAKEHRKRAAKLAKTLPEAERLLIETMVAESKDARNKALSKLAEKVPGDWEVQVLMARGALRSGEIDVARAAFEKAVELNPNAAHPHNNLAYLYAEKGDFDRAVEMVTKYAKLSPGEPNPLDSKGEILLMAGKFAESEAAFAEALKLADDFAIAHEGIAATKFYRGDWTGGVSELRAGVGKAKRAIDRHELQKKLGWALLSTGDEKGASEAFSAARASAAEAGMPSGPGQAKMLKAEIALKKGDYSKASKYASIAIEAMAAENVPEKKQHWPRTVATIAAARAGNVEAAEKSLSSLKSDAKGSHYLAYAQTHVAIAKGEFDQAIAAAGELKNDKWFAGRARLLTAEALEKAGKTDDAAKVRSELAERYRRDIHSVILAKEAKKAGEG